MTNPPPPPAGNFCEQHRKGGIQSSTVSTKPCDVCGETPTKAGFAAGKELFILLGHAYREARKRGHQLFTVKDMRAIGLRGAIPWQRKIGHLRYDNRCKLCGHRFSIEPKPFGQFKFTGLAARQLCRA